MGSNNLIFALDVGTRSIIGVVAEQIDGDKLKIKAQCMLEHECRSMYDGQIHDIPKVASGVSEVKLKLEKKLKCKLDKVAIAAAGRSLKTKRCQVGMDIDENIEVDSTHIHGLEMTALQTAHQQLMAELSGADNFYCVGYSVVCYYLNNFPISNLIGHRGKNIGIEVLATFLPDSVINSLYAVLHRAELEPINLTLEPIAAIDIVIPEEIRMLNLALVDIGAGTSDIAITSDGSITAYGMVPVAGDEITEAIVDACLVDFNTAENIKRQLTKKKITYTDILGIETTVSSQSIIDMIDPILSQLIDKIAREIISLNGNKSPKTVFCIGGGSQIPKLNEMLAERLQLPPVRVAVRGRDMLNNVVKIKKDPISGPDGVTVLGIANIAFKKIGYDFISITINNKDYSLLNAKDLTVAHALGLISYNPRNLIVHNGKDLTFKLNGQSKTLYGELGQPAQIIVNEQPATMQTIIKNGDVIDITSAIPGKDARLTLAELLSSRGCKMNQCNVTVNGLHAEPDYVINCGDEIKIVNQDQQILINNTGKEQWITVVFNGEKITLVDVKEPVFVDIFNFVDFNLTGGQGVVTLKCNGEPVEYTQPLNQGDVIEVYWQDTKIVNE
ncbi:cell division FtsA domain-containing protein [Peptococcaceae bacterium 1198_IL3148]